MYKKLLIILFLSVSCKTAFVSGLRDGQKMPPASEWQNNTSLGVCSKEVPYPHEILSCKTYSTNLKCCDWHKEDIDRELGIVCWETWCFKGTESCWDYREYICDNYTPLK